MTGNQASSFPELATVVRRYLGKELDSVRQELLPALVNDEVQLLPFCETCIAFIMARTGIDRVYLCNSKNGDVVAGWSTGHNVLRKEDWEAGYIPLDMDQTLQQALERDEVVFNPVEGVGADLVVPIRFQDGNVWLLVLDETVTARVFDNHERAQIRLVRDMMIGKAKLVAS